MAAISICSVDGCCKPRRGREWCAAHYARWRKYGDPLEMRKHGAAQRWVASFALSYEGDECLPWPFSRNARGYGTIGNTMASRYICEAVNGAAPTRKHQAAHNCGKGHEGCVNPRHLEWKTCSENQMDKIGHGTTNRGERNAAAKLTPEEVRQIRANAGSVSNRSQAAQYGVSSGHISQIVNGQKWAFLE